MGGRARLTAARGGLAQRAVHPLVIRRGYRSPMRILHLSDTHLYGDPAARHYDRIDTTAALAGLLARLEHLQGIDAVVHAGDASEDGSVESYRMLHELLDPFAASLGAKLVVAMGNHDVPAVYSEVAGPGELGASTQDRVVTLEGGGRIVVLDSSVPGAGYGHLEVEQLDWLQRVLAVPAADGTALVIHHPPLVAATTLMRGLDLDGLDLLAGILAGSDVTIVLSGHYHHEMTGVIGGVPVHVVPGVTNVADAIAAGEREQTWAQSGASIIELSPNGPRVMTSVYPNAGDTLQDMSVPVYDLAPEQVTAILEAAGRPTA